MLTALPAVLAGQQPPYAARHIGDIVQLQDAKAETTVSLVPSAGNVVYEMLVRGQNVLNFNGGTPEEFTARGGGMTGIPFVGPFANRLDEAAFYANGRKYAFDMQLGNVRGAIPIHGFLTSNTRWQVIDVKADGTSAWVTSRLEFYKNPMWMKQFPFAHTLEMTHRLQNGVLEVSTSMTNLSVEPMPVAIGFHPYFQLTDSTRADWTISIAAATHWLLAANKIPTGETEATSRTFPDPNAVPIKDYDLDDVFGDLIRDASGRATMVLKGPKSQRIEVSLGVNYRSVIVWAPSPGLKQVAMAPGETPAAPPAGQQPARNFVCFEPMAGITDSMNLAQRGLYKDLQSIPPGGSWQASFWVHPIGF
jgi:aldose 1-epimerase